MASFQMKNTFGDKSDSEVLDSAKQAIVNAGYVVWKTRDLAKLVWEPVLKMGKKSA